MSSALLTIFWVNNKSLKNTIFPLSFGIIPILGTIFRFPARIAPFQMLVLFLSDDPGFLFHSTVFAIFFLFEYLQFLSGLFFRDEFATLARGRTWVSSTLHYGIRSLFLDTVGSVCFPHMKHCCQLGSDALLDRLSFIFLFWFRVGLLPTAFTLLHPSLFKKSAGYKLIRLNCFYK